MTKHSHYHKDTRHLDSIDVYRVLKLFGVSDPCLQHAIKKLLVAGGRGAKPATQDIQEAIDTLTRWQAMEKEDAPQSEMKIGPTPPSEVNVRELKGLIDLTPELAALLKREGEDRNSTITSVPASLPGGVGVQGVQNVRVAALTPRQIDEMQDHARRLYERTGRLWPDHPLSIDGAY